MAGLLRHAQPEPRTVVDFHTKGDDMPDRDITQPAAQAPVDRLALAAVDPRGAQPAQGFSMDCYCVAQD